ncbi:histidine phosphatase family protein [Anaerocolumna sp.]|uniref:histidine phosphatase family protein n=1 Tax=Anaerocolumna sp. TaxID=2041569 RepID=UPI0028AB99C9|nr:histidine phosphatase family protein [Anaerocolumna sp.]
MKTEVYLVRHGETEWNKLGRFQGCTDLELSEEGIKQAQCLKERFQGNFDYIFSSPLKRAFHTASIICEDSEMKPIIVDEITEINFGSWEGLTLKDIKEKYPEDFHAWRTDELNGPITGGELSTKNASIRAKNAIYDLVNKYQGSKIVVVAHGGIIKAGLIGLFNWRMNMYRSLNLNNTAVTHLVFKDSSYPVIMSFNDTGHLEK